METTGTLENSSAKSPSEKEQLLALGVEKYIAVMPSFLVWQIWCASNIISNYSELDGDGWFTHFRLEVSFSGYFVQKISGI